MLVGCLSGNLSWQVELLRCSLGVEGVMLLDSHLRTSVPDHRHGHRITVETLCRELDVPPSALSQIR